MITTVAPETWGEELRQYTTAKRGGTQNLNTTKPHFVTEKEIKARDAEYNPVLQKYNNPEREIKTKKTEEVAMKETLAKNKV